MARWLATARARGLLAATVVAILVGATAHGTSSGLGGALLYLLPPLMLLLALATRRYPGERTLLALIGRSRRHRPRPRVADDATTSQRPHAALPRGGRLIASSLAVRPPPVAVVAYR